MDGDPYRITWPAGWDPGYVIPTRIRARIRTNDD
jgi:hypothetical protein